MKKIITRNLISAKISKLLREEISIKDFGEEMFRYLAYDDEFKFEKGYEKLINDVLECFSEMHDVEEKNPGYIPDIPSRDRLIELKKKLDG